MSYKAILKTSHNGWMELVSQIETKICFDRKILKALETDNVLIIIKSYKIATDIQNRNIVELWRPSTSYLKIFQKWKSPFFCKNIKKTACF